MIIAIDIETKGLNAKKFVIGCLLKEKKKKPTFYTNPKKLWEDVITLGLQEAKNKRTLNVYSHNAQYDTAGYIDLTDKHLTFYSNRPFIWGYALTIDECKLHNIPFTKRQELAGKKEIIKFLDSMSIYKGSLAKLGLLLNIPKKEMPKELLNTRTKVTKKLLKKTEPYVQQDTNICLQGILHMKKLLKEEDTPIKRLYTINQIAIGQLLRRLQALPEEQTQHLFYNRKLGIMHRTFRSKEIHAAYRGGRVEAFKTGTHNNVTYLDCNSLYPYILMNMDIPDLRSERKHWRPLDHWTIQETISPIGLSRALLKNNKNKLGLLPIRTIKNTYYPEENTYLLGTYTNTELQTALQEGYDILAIEWTIHYKKGTNPFTKIFNELYEKRKRTPQELQNWVYKMFMNGAIGKMAQHRTGQEILIDDVDNAKTYLAQQYEIIRGIKNQYMYRKDTNTKKKKYYVPIIPTLVNAQARLYLYKELKKIPKKDLLYTDTDSIIFTGNHKEKITKRGTELGEYKTVYEKEKIIIYGKKTYAIGQEIKISGFRKRDMTLEQFEKGIVTSKQQITINTAKKLEDVGTFTTEKRDLHKQQRAHENVRKLLKEQRLLIDSDIEDINYFIPYISKITP